MKKETLLEIIFGTIGGLFFSIGMTMCLVDEWNALKVGIVFGVIGFIILLCIISIYKSSHPKKEHKKVDIGIIITWVIGVVGALIMGFGMSKIMSVDPSRIDIVIGMITGIVGLIVCILNYPIYAYIKSNK